MPLLKNISQLATCRASGRQDQLHIIEDAALAWDGEEILWLGRLQELPDRFADQETFDAGGRLVVPGLVDCHTHLAFGGWRADEFESRLRGRSYLEIAQAGGGILSTVKATRCEGRQALVRRCLGFLGGMRRLGVTTVECKSGYGLSLNDELTLLEVYRSLQERQPTRIVSTFLGAHVVAPEFRDRREEYVELLIAHMIPTVAQRGLASFCDVFVEEGAFDVDQARRILRAGQSSGLGAKLHADQLTSCGGAELAAEVGAVSADHLECISDRGIAQMAASGTVAVSLPLATLYLNRPPLPARKLIEAGVRVAVATDFNPGSAPSFHLPLAMMLACNLQRMTPAESLKGATIYAAEALGLGERIGSLEVGKVADFALIDAPDVNHWMYHFSANACRRVWIGGRPFETDWPSSEPTST